MMIVRRTKRKLEDVVPRERARRWIERTGVSPDDNYALVLDGAETAFHWDGTRLVLFRLDDVGKLED